MKPLASDRRARSPGSQGARRGCCYWVVDLKRRPKPSISLAKADLDAAPGARAAGRQQAGQGLAGRHLAAAAAGGVAGPAWPLSTPAAPSSACTQRGASTHPVWVETLDAESGAPKALSMFFRRSSGAPKSLQRAARRPSHLRSVLPPLLGKMKCLAGSSAHFRVGSTDMKLSS